MKRIGILTRVNDYNYFGKRLFVPENIYLKVKDFVDVILIPHSSEKDYENVLRLVNICDGVIIPGGRDIYPLETKLVKYLYEKDIPTLGICLGMQTMGEAIGGKLDHLPQDNHHDEKNPYVHEISIEKNSRLYNILGQEKIKVNSRHHDYITNTNLNVCAYSLDNIIEALEDSNKRFFIGLQWHPEDLNDPNSDAIFKAFIDSL